MLEVLQDYYRGLLQDFFLPRYLFLVFLEDISLLWVSKPEWAPLFTIGIGTHVTCVTTTCTFNQSSLVS